MISARSSSSETSSTRPSKSFAELRVESRRPAPRRRSSGRPCSRAAREVAELVGQLGLVALAERDRGDAAVLAEGDLAEAVVAQRVGPEAVHDLERVQHVAQRLAHLVLGARSVLHQQEAVDEDLASGSSISAAISIAGQNTAWNFRMSLPMMWNGRPELRRQVLAGIGEGQRRVVVQQRVEPDVEDVAGVPRDLDAPGQLGAAEADVVQAARDERVRLVVPRARADELGLVRVQLLELLLEGGELEEPVLLLLMLERDLVDRARLVRADLVLGLEVRAARAVPGPRRCPCRRSRCRGCAASRPGPRACGAGPRCG